MKVLLHTCCAPCTTFCRKSLEEDGMEVTGYFYNPNIHPYKEFERRRDTMKDYAARTGFSVVYHDGYELEDFIRNVVFREAERCRFCYYMRLKKAAEVAKELGADAFSTTLLISPYQKHDLIRATGELVSQEEGIPFLYKDFRSGYRESVRMSRGMGLYRQPYCGCIYSEKERYSGA
ncbi:MAG TPA: epoxyqueuosine reductase QueH [Firmicutes bacterium]|nr:epoxyqueuosine reductase QueH [Bacillota bacterium]